ncbi:MAG: hypothetical protein ABI772_09965 [Bacteroidota bacterium]
MRKKIMSDSLKLFRENKVIDFMIALFSTIGIGTYLLLIIYLLEIR